MDGSSFQSGGGGVTSSIFVTEAVRGMHLSSHGIMWGGVAVVKDK